MMDIGIGLPTAVPGVKGADIVTAAQHAEALGFASLGVIDRLLYPNFDPLVALAAAAAATDTIRLASTVLVPTFRGNAVLLAKQTGSIHQLSNERLVLGLAAGGRQDDFDATGSDFAHRGSRMVDMISEMRRVWAADPVTVPGAPGSGPSIILGGRADITFERVARHADGWIAGGGNASFFPPFASKVRTAWQKHGRAGSPRLMSIGYYALGPDAEASATRYLSDYYAFLGDAAKAVAGFALTTPEAVRREAEAYAEAGCEELILFPCSAEPDQIDRLAELLL
jgi:alkanesulfonate monooxygenase SsuD/methylene tetrahydromethanopterin reductase-like flavin-dependent oxidoreductase (luciferase family)